MGLLIECTQAIASKKALYTRAIDTGKWSLLDTIVPRDFSFKMLDSKDTVMRLEGIEVNFTNREDWKAYFRELLKAKQSTHLVGHPEIEQSSLNEIKTIFGAQFLISDRGACPTERLTAAGHYHDTWKKVGDNWLLTDVALKICYMTFES